MLIWPFGKKKFQLLQWRRRLSLKQHAAIFEQLYCSINGYALSRSAREANDAIEYVYGEIEFESFIALLSLVPINENTVFYDLGSGIGKAVIACALVYPVKQSNGIELFPLLHQTALNQQHKLSQLPNYHHQAAVIRFIEDDLMNFNDWQATLIFINATAFFGQYWLNISQHLEQARANTIIISTSKQLCSEKFSLIKQTYMQMSWGVITVFIQQRMSH